MPKKHRERKLSTQHYFDGELKDLFPYFPQLTKGTTYILPGPWAPVDAYKRAQLVSTSVIGFEKDPVIYTKFKKRLSNFDYRCEEMIVSIEKDLIHSKSPVRGIDLDAYSSFPKFERERVGRLIDVMVQHEGIPCFWFRVTHATRSGRKGEMAVTYRYLDELKESLETSQYGYLHSWISRRYRDKESMSMQVTQFVFTKKLKRKKK